MRAGREAQRAGARAMQRARRAGACCCRAARATPDVYYFAVFTVHALLRRRQAAPPLPRGARRATARYDVLFASSA